MWAKSPYVQGVVLGATRFWRAVMLVPAGSQPIGMLLWRWQVGGRVMPVEGEGVVVVLLLGEALGDGVVGVLGVGMMGARELKGALVGIWLLVGRVSVGVMAISAVAMCWFRDSWPP